MKQGNQLPKATPAAKLRAFISQEGILAVPGVYDCLTALMAERAGFGVAMLGGNATTASLLGLPDLGFLSLGELVNQVKNVCQVLRIPLKVDADTGFGGPLQVFRTFRELERAGAAAIQIEDQIPAKRCGLLEGGHPLVSPEEMKAKVEACLQARENPDTVIIARTLAYSSFGLEEAIRRAQVYRTAGADAIFVQVPGTPEELKKIRAEIDGPLALNMDESTEASALNLGEAEALGYKLALFPGSIRYTVVRTIGELLSSLKKEGSTKQVRNRMASLGEYHEVLRMEEFLTLDQRLR
ncbi:MAG: oxaloacetate decarboxylase [Candidatus Binatia bacterium]